MRRWVFRGKLSSILQTGYDLWFWAIDYVSKYGLGYKPFKMVLDFLLWRGLVSKFGLVNHIFCRPLNRRTLCNLDCIFFSLSFS
jgi:hypothetical protein